MSRLHRCASRPHRARGRASILVLFFILALPVALPAQVGLGGGGRGRIEGRFKFLPLPYVNYNRSIGLTGGALPALMFNPVMRDTLSPSSVGGALAMYAANKTWFVAGFAKLYLAEDRWRVTASGGGGAINFQFYLDNPIDKWVPYTTDSGYAFLEVQRRIVKNVYGGVSYIYLDLGTSTEAIPDTLYTELQGVGVLGSMDTRTNVYYPRGGFLTNARYFAFPEVFGNDRSNGKLNLDFNKYWPIRDDHDVIAARVFVGVGTGHLSFNQQYIVGRTDIRGYTQGEYRGDDELAIQGEYRWNFARRWGAVGFLGLATVFQSINPDDDGTLLPGIGAGIRFTAFTENHMNIGWDVAVGRGDWGMYFRFGEAF